VLYIVDIFDVVRDSHISWNDRVDHNDPYTWDSNSIQDAALYILMNLALTPLTRTHLRNDNVARRISVIARYSCSPTTPSSKKDEEKQKDLQCLKARMTLAYLFGSEGYFGQSVRSQSASPLKMDRHDDLLIKGSEAPLLVELLSNSIHGRGKSGAGGYNASTFNAKKALYAIRCLLTNPLNVKTFFVTCGVKLNILLLKALALHSIQEVLNVDLEAAEDACFSLYLLSKFGFMGSFLPPSENGYPFENIIHLYSKKKTCTTAGKHAATQLLLRHPYLKFDGNLDDDEPRHIVESDLELGDALLHAAEAIEIYDNAIGEEPLDDIFGRPLTRRLMSESTGKKMPTPWESSGAVSAFISALDAVQELSFGSKLNDNMGYIDDIQIANNIAKSANGEDGESYGFEWSWQGDGGLDEKDVRQRLNEFRSGRIDSFRGLLRNVRSKERPASEPITIFGINCGCNSVIVE